MFGGQGQYYEDMGRHLYDSFTVFQASVLECDSYIESLSGMSLIDDKHMFVGLHTKRSNDKEDIPPSVMLTELAITVMQIALCDLLSSLGLKPSLVFGHSLGNEMLHDLNGRNLFAHYIYYTLVLLLYISTLILLYHVIVSYRLVTVCLPPVNVLTSIIYNR